MRFGRFAVILGLATLLMSQTVAHAAAAHGFTTVTVTAPNGKVCSKSVVNGITNGGKVVGTAFCGSTFAFTRTPAGKTRVYQLPAKDGAFTSASNIEPDGTLILIGQATAKGAPTTYLVSPSGTVTAVRDPKAHGLGTVLQSVNAHGKGVGYYCANAKCTKQSPILYDKGTFTKIILPNAITKNLSLTGINNAGKIAGYYFDSHGVAHGVIVKGHKYRSFDAMGAGHKAGSGTYILGLSSNGSICGDSVNGSYRVRGFITVNGKTSLVDRQPGQSKPQTEVIAINAYGEFGGESHLTGHGTATVGYLSHR